MTDVPNGEKRRDGMPRIIWKLLSIAIFVIFVVALQGCALSDSDEVRGSGKVKTERKPAVDVRNVNFDVPGKLTIALGDKEELVIKAEDNFLPLFDVEIVGDSMSIFLSDGASLKPKKPIEFNLTVKVLNGIELSGSGDITAPDIVSERLLLIAGGSGSLRSGDLKADIVDMEVAGSGKLKTGDVVSDRITLAIRGSGDVELGKVDGKTIETQIEGSGNVVVRGGKVLGQRVSIFGSGNYKAKSLRSTGVQVELVGDGDATLRAKEDLFVVITGSGNLRYYGDPEVEERLDGTGKVKKVD